MDTVKSNSAFYTYGNVSKIVGVEGRRVMLNLVNHTVKEDGPLLWLFGNGLWCMQCPTRQNLRHLLSPRQTSWICLYCIVYHIVYLQKNYLSTRVYESMYLRLKSTYQKIFTIRLYLFKTCFGTPGVDSISIQFNISQKTYQHYQPRKVGNTWKYQKTSLQTHTWLEK